MGREIIVAASAEDFAGQASRLIADAARSAISRSGRFSIALSGGSTVAPIYARLSSEPGIDWTNVIVFWGDERFVALDNPYSNFRLGREALLDRVPIPDRNIHPMPVGARTPRDGARQYSETLKNVLGIGPNGIPVFDMIQLGMGPDGHTASLFPGNRTLGASSPPNLVRAVHAGLSPWVDRLTFTLPLINAAQCVLIAAAGANKAARIRQVLQPSSTPTRPLPVALVAPTSGRLVWLLDKAAAEEAA
ncbi:MAG: 6-phosphogluconolactonase [Capsulimonadaceae bacterium]|nr:6-phosphogluconolactonase [Capsulimonadaceae bacterium]